MKLDHFMNTMQENTYEEPISMYTDLRPVSENYKRYDNLFDNPKMTKQQQMLTAKYWIILVTTIVILCALSCGITYVIVHILLNQDGPSSCESRHCGIGKCYLDTNGTSFCLCPVERYVTNCDIKEYRVKKIFPECPTDWFTHGSWCYKEYLDKKTWSQSRDFCRSIGTELLSIHDQSETNFLIRQFSLNTTKYWIGLRNQNWVGQFTWSDGTYLNFTYWSPGEPNNFNNNEHCVHLFPTYPGKWNDNNCFMSLEFICKMKHAPQCGTGPWLFYKDSCYMLNGTANAASWYEALQICDGLDADLAIIHSKDEYSFLLSQVTKSKSRMLWIGLSVVDGMSRYEWLDGTSISFSSWHIGEPENASDSCVGISQIYGNWHTEKCLDKNGFICKKMVL